MSSLLKNLYQEQEPSVTSLIKRLSLLFSQTNLIKKIRRVKQHYDEPQFFQFSADLNSHFARSDSRDFTSRASGFSVFSEEVAFLKCCGESIERYCNHVFFKNSVKYVGSFSNISQKACNPQEVASFSNRQRKENPSLKLDKNSVFRWTEGKSLLNGEKVLIPSQLIYLSYPRLKEEPIIYPSISTGAAGGGRLSAAIIRGIYEIVERDSYMIHYLNKIPSPRVDLKNINNSKIQKLLKIAKRYKLEIVSVDITTDLQIPAYASIVIDRTEIGKAISVGLKANLDKIQAIIGSINEAFHTRPWMRREYEKREGKIGRIKLDEISSFIDRGLLWYPKAAIKKLDFWLRNPKTLKVGGSQSELTSGEQLRYLIYLLKKHTCDAYFVDIAVPPLKKFGYFVAKVIMPQLHPVYLNEKYCCLGGKRLYEIPKKLGFEVKEESELNQYPHPFL